MIINALKVTQVSATTSAVTLKCAERGALHNLPLELTTEATRSSRTPGVGELAALRRGFAVDSIRRYTDELRAHPSLAERIRAHLFCHAADDWRIKRN